MWQLVPCVLIDTVFLAVLLAAHRDVSNIALALHCGVLVGCASMERPAGALAAFRPIHVLAKLLWYMAVVAVAHTATSPANWVVRTTGIIVLGLGTYIVPATFLPPPRSTVHPKLPPT